MRIGKAFRVYCAYLTGCAVARVMMINKLFYRMRLYHGAEHASKAKNSTFQFLTLLSIVGCVSVVLFLQYNYAPVGSYSVGSYSVSGVLVDVHAKLDHGRTYMMNITVVKPSVAVHHGRNVNSTAFVSLSRRDIEGVEKFVLFVGHGHSGHSIIGAILDAHPNVIMAHEYRVLEPCILGSSTPQIQYKRYLFNNLYRNSYYSVQSGWRSLVPRNKGYNLHIESQWQGTFSQLKVIGDKGGGKLSDTLIVSLNRTTACFRLLKEKIQMPIVLFHVVRNPFDMLASYFANKRKFSVHEMISKGTKLNLTRHQIIPAARIITRREKSLKEWLNSEEMKDTEVVHIHSEEFIKDPPRHVREMCHVLNVPCPPDYVQACDDKVYQKVSASHEIINCNKDIIEEVRGLFKQIPSFSGYI